MNDDLVRRRDALLEAVLPEIAFEGWTDKAVEAGTAAAGIAAGEAAALFPGGVAALREFLDDWADRRMVEALRASDLAALRLHQRVALGVKLRLRVLAPWREPVRAALAARLRPSGPLAAARAVWRTADLIWWEAGDGATDFNFYTKRALLSAVLADTLLYWLGDASPDAADSETYVDRRIADAGRITRFRRRAETIAGRCLTQLSQIRREIRL